jgi:hypothetical protein
MGLNLLMEPQHEDALGEPIVAILNAYSSRYLASEESRNGNFWAHRMPNFVSNLGQYTYRGNESQMARCPKGTLCTTSSIVLTMCRIKIETRH